MTYSYCAKADKDRERLQVIAARTGMDVEELEEQAVKLLVEVWRRRGGNLRFPIRESLDYQDSPEPLEVSI